MVYAKALNDMQESVLRQVGADKVVKPEEDMGERLADHLLHDSVVDFVELPEGFSLRRIRVPAPWCNQSLAELNLQKAAYARNTLTAIDGVRARFTGPVFNEFVLEFDRPWREIESRLRQGRVLGGLDLAGDYPELANCALVCVTETHAKEDIDRLASSLKEALS